MTPNPLRALRPLREIIPRTKHTKHAELYFFLSGLCGLCVRLLARSTQSLLFSLRPLRLLRGISAKKSGKIGSHCRKMITFAVWNRVAAGAPRHSPPQSLRCHPAPKRLQHIANPQSYRYLQAPASPKGIPLPSPAGAAGGIFHRSHR